MANEIDLGQECVSDLIDFATPNTDDVVLTEEVSGTLTRDDPPQDSSDRKMDTGEVDELAEPQPMTPVEDLVMTSSPSSQNGGPSTSETTPPPVEPARSSAATQTEKSLDWPKLWSDSAGNHNELIATEPDPVPTAVRADLVKKRRTHENYLSLTAEVLSILAENADVLHTKTFRESDKMKNLIGIAQLLYHSESKYSSVAHHVLKSSLDSVEKRQARFYEGKEPSVVIKDTPPADRAPKADAKPAALPGKTFWNPQCKLIQEEASTSKSSSGSASPLVAPRPLTATPTHRSSTQTTSSGSGWPIPASNDNGWGSSSSTDWSQPVTTASTGLGSLYFLLDLGKWQMKLTSVKNASVT
ncbi:Oidioi.mRNA.OKI2018_I69.PAR.g12934.t1.cds [Oikopleura dioica]|uniref:Oidioi.mRNA.OKI2018_I69.PAR.g12934.t1.cds n=1 Tax=Oikopleura dioica TaxID=34765 RepID=A0ABN7S5U4_OIKDI|nr:Oidioi.mRNA.OKI2018_I69.PAR.g12934.t1.cds [Oikopleura dioica]